MRKNSGYFEMLKSAADINCDILNNILENKQNGTNKLDFKALKNELFFKILDEFVPPIERTDIYSLFSHIELIHISLCKVEAFNKSREFQGFLEYIGSLKKPLSDFSDSILLISSVKSPKKLADVVSCNKKLLEINFVGLYRKLALGNSFTEISFFKTLCELVEALFTADTEIEKIIINNN